MMIIILDPAEKEIEEMHDFLESRRPGLGEKFLVQIEKALDRIGESPRSYAKYFRNIRLCPLGRFKHGLFYEIGRKFIFVQAIIDLRRSPGYIRKRLK